MASYSQLGCFLINLHIFRKLMGLSFQKLSAINESLSRTGVNKLFYCQHRVGNYGLTLLCKILIWCPMPIVNPARKTLTLRHKHDVILLYFSKVFWTKFVSNSSRVWLINAYWRSMRRKTGSIGLFVWLFSTIHLSLIIYRRFLPFFKDQKCIDNFVSNSL